MTKEPIGNIFLIFKTSTNFGIKQAAFSGIQFNALNFGLLKNIILAIVPGTITALMSFRLEFLAKDGSLRAIEIGTLRRAKTYNILNISYVEPGALTLSISPAVWINTGLILYFCIIVFSGTMGS